MSKLIDLTGLRFGGTVVVSRAENTASQLRWLCMCDCGRNHIAYGGNLRSGKTKSCGCLRRHNAVTHDMSRTSTYGSWQAMKARCSNPNKPQFKDYGGRGISYDPKWESFEGFLADMGKAPKDYSIDRIDNNSGYYKENCRWTDDKIQARNRRTTYLTVDDATIILTMRQANIPRKQVAQMFGISGATVQKIEHRRTWVEATRLPI